MSILYARERGKLSLIQVSLAFPLPCTPAPTSTLASSRLTSQHGTPSQRLPQSPPAAEVYGGSSSSFQLGLRVSFLRRVLCKGHSVPPAKTPSPAHPKTTAPLQREEVGSNAGA